MKLSTLWTSEPMTIGKHDWRVGVGVFRIGAKDERCTFYEWRRIEDRMGAGGPPHRAWWPDREFPRYDCSSPYNGLPRALAQLYEFHLTTLQALLDGNFRTELTPAGEQTVIPGCERNAAPGIRQLELFG